ncbi:unannotated protein [freshwater metagenome]|uniref:Unannotated protein n=1 Tax=freshwater metagenome TaxID=449393 RepID=A0A6J6WYC9_9ZZZZ
MLSTISGTPASWAIFATAAISNMSFLGLAIVSPNSALVFGRIAFFQLSGSSGFSTKVTSTPNFGSV